MLVAVAVLTSSCVDRAAPDPAPPPTTQRGPVCPESGWQVEVGTADAAMGIRVMGLTLTNCGDRTFTLDGYPDVQVLDQDGEPLPVTVVDGDIASVPAFAVEPTPVPVEPGDTAISGILWRNRVTTGPAVTGYGLAVRPVDGDRPQRLLDEDLHIDLGDTGTLGVRAWTVSP